MHARIAAALLAAAFTAAVACLPGAAAHEYRLGPLVIDQPWARASAGNAPNGAAFLTIRNDGDSADRLLSVSTPASDRAELHTHVMDSDGVMKMRAVEAIEIAPGGETALAPGGLHVMLMGLGAPLVEGTSFPATLTFEKAGEIAVEVTVEGIAAMGSEAQHGAGHDMPMDGAAGD